MLLSLPILHLARVNALLLQGNKPPLFIQYTAYNTAAAAKLFLLFQIGFYSKYIRYYGCYKPAGLIATGFRAMQPFTPLLFIQKHKRRAEV